MPKGTPRIPDQAVILAEFRNTGEGQINLSIELQPDGLVAVVGATKVQQKNDMAPPKPALWKAIDRTVQLDHWYDFTLDAVWSPGKKGKLRLYLGDRLVLSLDGPNTAYNRPVHMQYGLYRSFVSKSGGNLPAQVIYFDHVAKAPTPDKLPPLE